MVHTNVIPLPEIQYGMRSGCCPACGKSDGFVNLGKEHWFICREHKMKWFGGSDLIEDWKDQTIAQALSVKALLEGYTEVVPFRDMELSYKRQKSNL